MKAEWNGVPIKTEFVYPPIPNRNFDWAAYLDGYEPGCVYGEGRSEAIAVADLVEQLHERSL